MHPGKKLILAVFVLIVLFFLPLYPFEITFPCPLPPCPDFAVRGDAFEWISSRDPWKNFGFIVFFGEVLLAYAIAHIADLLISRRDKHEHA